MLVSDFVIVKVKRVIQRCSEGQVRSLDVVQLWDIGIYLCPVLGWRQGIIERRVAPPPSTPPAKIKIRLSE